MDAREKLVELLNKQKGMTLPIWTASQTVELMADALITHGVTVQEWISVKDRLPDDKEYDCVLVNILLMPENYYGVPCAAFLENGKWYDDHGGLLDPSEKGCGVIVTHWMPLPQPPKGE